MVALPVVYPSDCLNHYHQTEHFLKLLDLAFDVSVGAEALHSSTKRMSMEKVVLLKNLFGVVLVDYFALEMTMQEVESVIAHSKSKNLMQQTVAAAAVVAAENDVAAASLWPSDMHRLAAGCWEHDLLVLENVTGED